jgi:NTE family protein
MGGVVGALHSIGYSAKDMQKELEKLDWDDVFNDDFSRKDIPIEDKDTNTRYIRRFQLKDKKIQLPSGLIYGQKLTALLARLMWPAVEIRDFSKFNVPFRCISTDLETGKAVVFDKGNLHEVLRASISIPTIFSPVEYEGKLLVDGMMARNLPAQDAKDMGADIIIAVDVGAPLYKKEKLNNILRITDQAMSFRIHEENQRQRKLCDLVIVPELNGGDAAFSFERRRQIIKGGEKAAKKQLPKLLKLLKDVKPQKSLRDCCSFKPKKLTIHRIKYDGLKKVSRSMLTQELSFKEGDRVDQNQLDSSIYSIYKTDFFETVTYAIHKEKRQRILTIKVKEKSTDSFSFGLRYDSDYHAAMLLSTTVRNVGIHNTKTVVDLVLSETPEARFRSNYYDGPRRKSGLGVDLSIREVEPYLYDANGVKTGRFNYDEISGSMMFGSRLSNHNMWGVGVRHQFIHVNPEIAPAAWQNVSDNSYTGLVGRFELDTLNRTYFPTKGTHLVFDSFVVMDSMKKREFSRDHLCFRKLIPVTNKTSVELGFKGGRVYGNDARLSPSQSFFLGGMDSFDRLESFFGLQRNEVWGRHMRAYRLGVQHQINKVFVYLNYNQGLATDNRRDLYDRKKMHDAYELGVGKNTAIGPVRLSMVHGNREKMRVWFSIGHRF